MRHFAAACALAAILLPLAHAGHAQEPPAPAPAAAAEAAAPLLYDRAHAVALHGDVKYPKGFTHFDFVNPDAPKGGTVTLGGFGSFDSLNPYIVKGEAAGISAIYETLTEHSQDEPFTEYGHLAQDITIPQDRSWVEYGIDPAARWHDGQPVTPEDVVWTFETLSTQGAPFYRAYYADVARAEVVGEGRVRFTFKIAGNNELPMIMGQMPVLPRHWWASRDFTATTLEPPLGSGPYRVGRVDAGRTVVLERVEDWWAKDRPVARGMYNFDRIVTDYYRDQTPLLEAFKSGRIDWRVENSAKNWATEYDIPAFRDGRIVKTEVKTEQPSGMQALAFNIRRPIFQDKRVRQALAQMMDFQWLNRSLFYGSYARTDSFFDNSELASSGVPEGDELAVLEPFRAQLPPELFTEAMTVPDGDGSGALRTNARAALRLLREAGWELKNNKLTDASGNVFRFEILNDNPQMERVVLPYIEWLKKIGIEASLRSVDSAQYEARTNAFDYDMIIAGWGQSLSPGNEQRGMWGCAARDLPGSQNAVGICDPVVDALIDRLVVASTRPQLVATTRALDRVLLSGWYVIPQYHSPVIRLAYWDRFGHPPKDGLAGPSLFTRWIEPTEDAALKAQNAASPPAEQSGGSAQ